VNSEVEGGFGSGHNTTRVDTRVYVKYIYMDKSRLFVNNQIVKHEPKVRVRVAARVRVIR
jgi:hypothetical protein